jgi:hypothetical protein
MEFHKKIYIITVWFSYILLFGSWLGISAYAPKYLIIVETILQLYVAIFLLIRFNPIGTTSTFTTFDRRIVFSSALFLFLTSSIGIYLKSSTSRLLNF